MKKTILIWILLLTIALAPCAQAKSAAVKKVSLVETEITMQIGETRQLNVVFKPDGSSSRLKWKCSHTKVATVDGGTVTALSAGTASITVKTKNGKKASCRITVTDPDKVVALTFDDGPCANTLEILKLLKQYDAKATFFMLGEMVAQNGSIAKTVAESNCEVACHGTSHKDFQKLSVEEDKFEISNALSIISDAAGVTPALIRAPYGAIDADLAKTLNYPFIQWSIDPEDWKDRDGKTVYQRIVDKLKPGSIVLMHDLYASTTDAVKLLLPELKRQGYSFLTVSELIAYRGIENPAGQVIY